MILDTIFAGITTIFINYANISSFRSVVDNYLDLMQQMIGKEWRKMQKTSGQPEVDYFMSPLDILILRDTSWSEILTDLIIDHEN